MSAHSKYFASSDSVEGLSRSWLDEGGGEGDGGAGEDGGVLDSGGLGEGCSCESDGGIRNGGEGRGDHQGARIPSRSRGRCWCAVASRRRRVLR